MSDTRTGVVGFGIKVRATENGAPADISAVSAKQYQVTKPDGTTVTWLPSFISDGTDGWLQYLTVSNDLNVAGEYTVDLYLSGFGSFTGRGDNSVKFRADA